MDYETIKAHFRIRQDNGDVCKAICPAHKDNQASLSISHDNHNKKTLITCHAGCDIRNILEKVNLKFTDLFDEEMKINNSNVENQIVYKYRDENRNVLFEKVRFDKPQKHFSQRRIINNAVVWGLDGGTYYETFSGSNNWSKKKRDNANTKEFEACEPVIYNLPEVLKAIIEGKEINIVEGEKDADNLAKLGFVATCNFDGASSSDKKPKWREEYNKYFKNAKVNIFNDNDNPGRAHADYIASQLINVAEYVKRVEIPNLLEKEDISDWIAAGHKKGDIEELIRNTSLYEFDDCTNQSLINFNFSDVGNAERLAVMYGKSIRFNPIRKKWIIWTSKFWEVDNMGKIEIIARKTIRKLQNEGRLINGEDEEKVNLKNQISKFVLRSESDTKIKAMINQAKVQTSLIIKKTDENMYLLNVKNGTLNLKTGTLQKHCKNDFITRMSPVEYNPKMTCPNWLKFIDTIFLGNKELINYVQKSIGYSLTGDTSLQCFYILYGAGANGKGTFTKAIMSILGEYAASLKGNSITEKFGDEGARGDLAKLENKYFVLVNELEEGKCLDEALVKSLTSGADETMPVRRMYEEEFDLHPTFKMWMTTNKMLKIKGTDNGIWRRVRKVPFDYIFKDEEKDEHFFENKLLPELSGILNWIVEGCIKWQKEGIQIPEIVQYATDEYKNEMDTIQRFIDEECIMSETCMVKVSQLYNRYLEWCEENKEYKLSSIKFSKKIAEKNFKQDRDKFGRFWRKIGILIDEEQIEMTEIKNNIYPFKSNK